MAELPPSLLRAPDLFFRLHDVEMVELEALLRQELRRRLEGRIELIEPFTGTLRPSSPREIEFLMGVSTSDPAPVEALLEAEDVEESDLRQWLAEGVLLAAGDERWRRRSSIAWNPVAALFHATSLHETRSEPRGQGAPSPAAPLDLEAKRRSAEADVARWAKTHGPPPPARVQYPAGHRLDLPVEPVPEDELFRTLSRRRTWRHFAPERLDLERASTLLRWTFGVQQTVRFGESYAVPMKTSPSGGSVHPFEAYPLVFSVAGLEPGVYHYDAFGHALERLCAAPEPAVRDLAVRLASGQGFAGEAAMAILMVARLDRNFWKYPESCRTFAVIHQDAGHLSQTAYLTATRLGLGAFYTAALDGTVARSELGIDEWVDAPLGLFGCGLPDRSAESWLGQEAYVPRSSPPPAGVEIRTMEGSAAELPELSETPAGGDHFRALRLTPPLEEG